MQIASQVSSFIKGIHEEPDQPGAARGLIDTLRAYSRLIEPWAASVARVMLTDVSRRNEKAWVEHSHDIGVELRSVIKDTPVGGAMRSLLADQVTLIKSIPLNAAERVHAIVQDEMPRGTRSTTMAQEIYATNNIPKWRAKLIARTETSRAAVTLTQVRAQAIGSQGYIWRTVGDANVRPEHAELNGTYVAWDNPPKTDKSLDPYHAGCGPNCRCYPEPVLPDY